MSRKAIQMIEVLYAKDTRSVQTDEGGQFVVHKGSHWAAGDPLVRQYPDLFTNDPRYGMNYTQTPEGYDPVTLEPLDRTAEPAGDTVIEQATAAPGEKRSTARGGRSAA